MADEEYEILPHQLLQDLKGEVEALKKKLTAPDAKANELILEIESAKDSIHELTMVFQKALEEVKDEDATKQLKTITERLEMVAAQNETIARGMVAISDKLEDFMHKQIPNQTQPPAQPMMPQMPAMSPHSMGTPTLPGQRVAPMPMDNFSTNIQMPDMPPPPPSPPGKRRTGLFR